MTAEKVGAPIGAGFGLGFVLANTGALPYGGAMILRVLAVVAFVAMFVILRRRRSLMGTVPPLAGRRFRPRLLVRRCCGGRSRCGRVSPVQRAGTHSAGSGRVDLVWGWGALFRTRCHLEAVSLPVVGLIDPAVRRARPRPGHCGLIDWRHRHRRRRPPRWPAPRLRAVE